MGILVISSIAVIFVMWMIVARRRLMDMIESTQDALKQIDIQMSSCFEVLIALMNCTKDYAVHESQKLLRTIKAHRISCIAVSVPEDARKQLEVISEALAHIDRVAEKYPEVKEHGNYGRCITELDHYKKKMQISCLIYNNSVTKLNREIRRFPTLLAAKIFRISEGEYLDIDENAAQTDYL